jgi:hypothetical protein
VSTEPWTRDEIVAALAAEEAAVAAFFAGLADDLLLLRRGAAWNPAEHLHHLSTSVNAVARGLALPRWLLRLRFGRARGPSRPIGTVRETYRAALAAGGRASGAFVPPAATGDAARVRAEVLGRWERANARLRGALARWTERDLDRVVLPHPLLGRITTREMLFFTLHHGAHHVASARARLPEAPAAG